MPGGKAGLPAVAQAAPGCPGCDLFENATQTVFGRGAAGAAVVLIGEQPGDAEDRAGQPFVGPAGQLLDRALKDAGLPPDDTYAQRGEALPLEAGAARREAPDPTRSRRNLADPGMLAVAGGGARTAWHPGSS